MAARFLKAAWLLAVLPALAIASEEAGHGEPDLTLSKWLHFAALFGLLVYGWIKMVAPGMRDRSARILAELDEARKARAASDAKVAGIQRRLGDLGVEIAAFRKEWVQLLAGVGAGIEQETAGMLDKINARAENEIAAFAKQAKAELKTEATRLAVELAGQRLSAGLTRKHHARLLTDFAAGLSAGSKN
jgi:F-type H+-transporting ATPase subunit b